MYGRSINKVARSLILLWAFSAYSLHSFSQGLSADIQADNLDSLIVFLDSVYSDEVLVIHDNKVIKHWKSNRCDSSYFNTASMLKSWTGLVFGTLIDNGLIESEHDLICKYLPDWKAGCQYKVTIKDLLSMKAGFNRRGGVGVLAAEDANAYAIDSKLDTLPDSKFGYSNVSAQLIGLLIKSVTGKPLNEYYDEVLFSPLGMDSTSLMRDFSKKNYLAYGGAHTTIEDASQVALLVLNKGKWKGKQVISETWIEKSTQPQHAFNDKYGYGFYWWTNTITGTPVYTAMGDRGKVTLIFPELNLIVLSQQTCDRTKFKRMSWFNSDFFKFVAGVVKTD